MIAKLCKVCYTVIVKRLVWTTTLGGILMLRFLEKCKQSIKTWAKGNNTFDWVLLGSWVLTALVIGTLVFLMINTTPATPEDYEPLVSRALFVEEKPIKMLEQNGNIRITDDEIMLEIENEKCKIIASYNRNFELQGFEKIDKSKSLSFSIIASGVCGFIGGFVVVNIIALIQLIYFAVSYYFSEFIYKWKLRKNKKH